MIKLMFKKKKAGKEMIAIVAIAIILILIISFSLAGSAAARFMSSMGIEVFSPMEKMAGGFFSGISSNANGIFSYGKNMKELERLKKENQELKKQVIELDLSQEELMELADLKRSLNYVQNVPVKSYVSSKVIAKNDGNMYESFVIDAGSNDGIENESIVLTGDGLAGIVYEVSKNYSKAISIINYKSAVSFKVLRKPDYMGVIRKNITVDTFEDSEGFLVGYMFDMDYDVSPGDILVTSGLGMYTEGIPIGEIQQVEEDKKSLVKNVKVKPYVDFKNIDKVMVVSPERIR